MVRRRLTIKRLDPWSVLKFGALANLVLFIVLMLIAALVWFVIDRLQLVDQACEIAVDVGFQQCAVDGGTVLRVAALLSGMIAVISTAVLVFASFLHNLIADLTGGLVIGVVEDAPARRAAPPAAPRAESATPVTSADPPDPGTPTASPETATRRQEDLFGER